MAERDFVELRSEDVQEILGTPPSWLVRWGTAIAVLGFIIMLSAAWFVRYPDVVEARVVVTTSIPPVDVVARSEGRIAKILIRDRQEVPKDKLLAVLQTTADYEDVLRLDEALAGWQRLPTAALRGVELPTDLNLGELQSDYADLVQQMDRFQFGNSRQSASIRSNIGSINQQIKQLEQSIAFDQKALKRTKGQLENAESLLLKQQELHEQGLLSLVELEKERNKVADIERQYEEQEENVIRKQNDIISLRRGINDASFSQQESTSSTTTQVLNSLRNLRSSLDKWKQTYLLTAPIGGKVSLNANFVHEQQYVKTGENVLTIVPPESDTIIGRLSLPIAGSGKVAKGQRVLIKLDNYPYHEFGAIRGYVVSKSLVPKDNEYAILVGLPHGLETTHKRTIPFEQQLQGKAEIITEDKGFLQRIGDQVFVGR